MIQGYVESVTNGWLAGWAWDPSLGDEALNVDIFQGEEHLATVVADQFREDLRRNRIGNGAHGFVFRMPEEIRTSEGGVFKVRVAHAAFELFNSPFLYRCPTPGTPTDEVVLERDFKLDPENFQRVAKSKKRWRFADLRVDVVDNCNANCIYCPTHRSGRRLNVESFRHLLETKIVEIERLQFGCGQEPTLHAELGGFFEAAARAACAPGEIQLVTNGMLLHHHDARFLRAAGLTRLLVSVDTARAETQTRLRPGTDLSRIVRNIAQFRQTCPDVLVAFSTVVSKINLEEMVELVAFGRSIGVREFIFRQVCDFSTDRPRKPEIPKTIAEISLPEGAFERMKSKVLTAYPGLRSVFIQPEALELGHRPDILLEEGLAPIGEHRIAQPDAR